MSGTQKAVLWIGLILVGLNLVSKWKEISGVIFNGAGIGAGIPGSSSSSSNNPPSSGIPKTIIPGLPGIPIPGTHVSLPLLGKQTGSSSSTKNAQLV